MSKFKKDDHVKVIGNTRAGHEVGVTGTVVALEVEGSGVQLYDIKSDKIESDGWVDQYWHGEDELELTSDTWKWSEELSKLKQTCNKINSLIDESCNGDLMYSQQVFLADLIKEFVNNPVVKYSGVLEKELVFDERSPLE